MNSFQVIVCVGALLGLASAIPQGFEQSPISGSVSEDTQTANESLDMTQAIIRAFTGISPLGNRRSSGPLSIQESQDALMRIMEASIKSILETEKRGFSVPYGTKERLETAAATIPATFQFLQKLSEISWA